MNNLKLILGGPGCGKTTRLLQIVEEEMEAGVSPYNIAFVTFTKAAAEEAKTRAAVKFNLDPEIDLPWFRTIHSLAYKSLNMTRDEMLEGQDWREFANVVGEIFDSSDRDWEQRGKRMIRVMDYAATTMLPLREAYNRMDDPPPWEDLVRVDAAFMKYKADLTKMDFGDLLLVFHDVGEPLPVEVAVIDEAQDLTAAQWGVVEKAFSKTARVYVGGDDDQAIYRWAGADVDRFLALSRTPEVLNHSYRLPRNIHSFGKSISRRITARYRKQFDPSGPGGVVEIHRSIDHINLRGTASWLLLSRNTYMLRSLMDLAEAQGVPYETRDGSSVVKEEVEAIYAWEKFRQGRITRLTSNDVRVICKMTEKKRPQLRELETYLPEEVGIEIGLEWYRGLTGIPMIKRDYYLNCIREGVDLRKPPRVRIETIHGVKGAEADNVLLTTDMSRKTFEAFHREPDHEHRVFYVGATRAKHELHLVAPQSDRGYPIAAK